MTETFKVNTGTNRPGRLRQHMAKLLESKGIDVDPSQIGISQGGQRRTLQFGWPSWWAQGIKKSNGSSVAVNSRYTMTECARSGILIREIPGEQDIQVLMPNSVSAMNGIGNVR